MSRLARCARLRKPLALLLEIFFDCWGLMMKKTDFALRKQEIQETFQEGDSEQAFEKVFELIAELFEEQDYRHIVQIYKEWSFLQPRDKLYLFEVAYSLAEQGDKNEAEKIYEWLLSKYSSPAILNNLSLIKKEKGQLNEAWQLISRAYELTPDDEIISRNYQSTLDLIEEQQRIDEEFRAAVPRLQRENEFVINKLQTFLSNVKKEKGYYENMIPIPMWKFRVLMRTDEQKSRSLVEQWLRKGYIRRTGKRGTYGEHIYQINPYLQEGLKQVQHTKIPKSWIVGFEGVNAERLAKLGYYEVLARIQRIRRKYRIILERDINELFLNYIMGSEKAVVVLAGSIVETLLMYYCEKKGITKISYARGSKVVKKNLYEAALGDLLAYFQEQKILSDLLVHLGNISRISRNFVHPGRELRDTDRLDQTKVDLCFMSALEIARKIPKRTT